jgi:hypothetical protein
LNDKFNKKTKRDELSGDEESVNKVRSMKPTTNVTKAIDFDSHVYSNNVVMGSTHDVNYELQDKFNKIYFSDQTRDRDAKSYMKLSQHDCRLDAKLKGTSKFTSRRDYQVEMAPRGTSGATSARDSDSQTRPPVLRLRVAGKPEHGESNCRSDDDTSDLADGNSDSSDDESNDKYEDEENREEFESVMSLFLECIP